MSKIITRDGLEIAAFTALVFLFAAIALIWWANMDTNEFKEKCQERGGTYSLINHDQGSTRYCVKDGLLLDIR